MSDALTDPRWFLLAGITLVVMALAGSVLRRLPITLSIVYLAIGAVAGPVGFGLVAISPTDDEGLLELLTELAVIVSLFTAGLKLRQPLSSGRWRRPLRLAIVSMVVTVALIAGTGMVWLGLSLSMAVLLGAVLAPTDPVLASDVQVSGPADREDLRISLTGEAGLNDGTAFPFVMLGLGLMGIHELGPFGVRWLVLDVAWAVVGGLIIGGLSGTLVARIVLYLRRTHREAVGLDEFLGLGLIALSYGLALSLHTYGFLAVFAAGLAVRQVERRETRGEPEDPQVIDEARGGDPEADATHPHRAPAYLAIVLLGFNEQLERIGEIALVVLVGAMRSTIPISLESVLFAALLFLVLRPIAVLVGLVGSGTPGMQRAYIAWFGIRGIGSLYYLMFALAHGLPDGLGTTLAEIVLVTVGMSIVIHGVSVTPLMERYEAYRSRRVLAP